MVETEEIIKMSINFVRKSSDDNRIERKKNLESKLEQAKIEYEAVNRKRQLEDQRGDSKWILPSLEKRIDENIHLKKKHKKKHKKHKKEEEVEEWEEADPKGVTVDQTCETGDQASKTVDHASKTSDDKYPCTESKLGNTASPQMQTFPKKKNSFSDVGVGDGGKSWIQKAYERSKLQAEEEGIPLEDVVAERWGVIVYSMAKLNALLKASENSSRSLLVSNNVSTSTKRCKDDKSCEQKTSFDNNAPVKKDHKDIIITKDSDNVPVKKDHKDNITTKDSDKFSNKVESNTSESILPTRIPLTDKEKNEISAKILRAELMGNTVLCAKLKLELQQGRIISTVNKSEKISTSTEDVLLTREDKHGNLYPLKLQHGAEELNRKRTKKKLVSMHDSEGNRVKYFEDDDCTSLKTMVENERLTTADEQHAMMHRMASKHLGSTMGDDYTVDDMFITASAVKGTTALEDKRTKTKAVAAHQLREKQLSSCRYCFENPKIAKHLIVAIGVTTYLALPINASLTDGHCLIIPMQHIIGQSFMDEDVQQEVKMFKRNLTSMFSNNDEDVLFIESCKNIHHQNHCIIECIPVPKEVGEMAPIYFKKAITESESEWSQNKKIVTITATGGISKAIPKGLSYFAVEFGLDGGFGHVIEDERLFPSNFGKEIIGGIMDLDVRLWRNPPKESFDQHKHKVLRFSEQWKPFDWTQDI
uniref:CWF19-like protein 2 n=1 Tax=Hydra vulgaris TaxID=6087 RepID=T2MCE1_HYDVU